MQQHVLVTVDSVAENVVDNVAGRVATVMGGRGMLGPLHLNRVIRDADLVGVTLEARNLGWGRKGVAESVCCDRVRGVGSDTHLVFGFDFELGKR